VEETEPLGWRLAKPDPITVAAGPGNHLRASTLAASLAWVKTETMSGYTIVNADEVDDAYADSDVPGEFRSLTEALASEQVAVTLIRVPPHSDFEQGTGHRHEEQEEIYIVTRGTLTMRFGDDVREVSAGSAVRVAPQTVRSHRNLGDEPVELWAVSRKIEDSDSTKVEDFWT
jgi:quercetin dioxygenase-like cupin family protein